MLGVPNPQVDVYPGKLTVSVDFGLRLRLLPVVEWTLFVQAGNPLLKHLHTQEEEDQPLR